jgi:hypothetical protein
MISRRSVAVGILGLVALGRNAWSQTPPPAEAAPPPDAVAAPMAPPAPPPSGNPPALASFKLEPAPGNTLKVGLLLQPQFQALGDHTLDGTSENLFLRRARILVGGSLFGVFDYFLDTDYPNLFLATNTQATATTAAVTTKNTPGMNIQDAFVTYHPMGDVIKVDAGYMLPPLAHNAVQGAGTLYSWDYFAFTFLSSESFGSSGNPVGRDLGVQLRGLLLDGHLEYRAGLFQGLRDADTATTVGSNNFFRATARVQINLLDPEPGFFYAGTYLGAKKILSIGGSVDTQSSYHYYAGDVFADLPVGGGGVFTAQINVAHWQGGSFVALPSETAFMSEAGFNIGGIHLSPILHYEYLHAPATATSGNQSRTGGGLAWWPFGHSSNLKAFYTRNYQQNTPHDDNQFNVQWQLYFL